METVKGLDGKTYCCNMPSLGDIMEMGIGMNDIAQDPTASMKITAKAFNISLDDFTSMPITEAAVLMVFVSNRIMEALAYANKASRRDSDG